MTLGHHGEAIAFLGLLLRFERWSVSGLFCCCSSFCFVKFTSSSSRGRDLDDMGKVQREDALSKAMTSCLPIFNPPNYLGCDMLLLFLVRMMSECIVSSIGV